MTMTSTNYIIVINLPNKYKHCVDKLKGDMETAINKATTQYNDNACYQITYVLQDCDKTSDKPTPLVEFMQGTPTTQVVQAILHTLLILIAEIELPCNYLVGAYQNQGE